MSKVNTVRSSMAIKVVYIFLLISCLLSAQPSEAKKIIRSYVQVADGKLYYEESGTGHPVILIGGGGIMDLRQWDEQFDYLKNRFRAIRVDPRGVGKSDLPISPYSNSGDIKALLDSLKIEKATVVGLSFAGGIALEFAIMYPERVCSVICSGPLVIGWQFSEEQKRRMASFAEATQKGPDEFIEVAFADPHFIPASQNPKARERARSLIPENFRSFDQSLMKQLDPPVIKRVSEISVPTLLIVGEKDHPDIHSRIDFLRQTIRNSRKVIIDKAGHIANMERPEKFNQEVAKFLSSVACRSER